METQQSGHAPRSGPEVKNGRSVEDGAPERLGCETVKEEVSQILQRVILQHRRFRCMAAKQRLTKGRMRARHLKSRRIAVLLGLPADSTDDPFSSNYLLNSSKWTRKEIVYGNHHSVFMKI